MLTRNHFIILANVIKTNTSRLEELAKDNEGIELELARIAGLLAGDIADLCQTQNPRFDRQQFINAATQTDDK